MHEQHSLTQLDEKKNTHANSCECPTVTQTHVSSDTTTHTIKNFRAGGAESPSRTRNYRRAGGEIPRNYQVGWWAGSGGWMLSCSSRPATEAAKNWPVS